MKKIYFILPILAGLVLNIVIVSTVLTDVALTAGITNTMQESINGFDLPNSGEEAADVKAQRVVGLVISAFLSLFGILFMILIIYGGYKWMMARGAEEEITKAKAIIRGAVIGLIITLMSYGIAYFVSNALQTATA